MLDAKKCAVMILAVLFAMCAICAYADDGWDSYDDSGGYSVPSSSRANVEIHMDENPPYVKRFYYWKKTFSRDGNYWVINELPKRTIFTVPEGYKARCIAFHTKNVRGKAGRTLDNGRVIYSAGTNVKYTYPSELRIYKD